MIAGAVGTKILAPKSAQVESPVSAVDAAKVDEFKPTDDSSKAHLGAKPKAEK